SFRRRLANAKSVSRTTPLVSISRLNLLICLQPFGVQLAPFQQPPLDLLVQLRGERGVHLLVLLPARLEAAFKQKGPRPDIHRFYANDCHFSVSSTPGIPDRGEVQYAFM